MGLRPEHEVGERGRRHAQLIRRAGDPSRPASLLPHDIERRLSRLPDGYVRIVVGTDVAILHTRTRVVVDLIEGIDD